MEYYKGQDVLPADLLNELRKYIPHGLVYIPTAEDAKRRWGENTGAREWLRRRNAQMRRRFSSGEAVETLAQDYCLAPDTVKKIVYGKGA